ncbi:hypothetical protein CAPTEDRAFT_203658, partial [Capitella teleta]
HVTILGEKPANCSVGRPCEYEGVVHFRVIVLTYNRPESLGKCLGFLEKVETMGDTMRIEIWIDRSEHHGHVVDNATVKIAEAFRQHWSHPERGRSCAVHIRERFAGLPGQWWDTWRPRLGSNEIGLILEDDIDVAPLAYKWLKAIHAKYDHRNDISGYTLQMQNVNIVAGRKRPLFAPKTEQVFMYPVLGTWGYSPHPRSWRNFQDWVHAVRDSPGNKFRPFVPGLDQINRWYNPRTDTLQSMWQIYYSYVNDLFCVYCNLNKFTGKENVVLAWNRQEDGLHHKGKSTNSTNNLLAYWNETFVDFPDEIIQFENNGTLGNNKFDLR